MQVIHKSPDQANLVPHAELVSKTKFELFMLMEQRFLIGFVLWLGLETGRRKQGKISVGTNVCLVHYWVLFMTFNLHNASLNKVSLTSFFKCGE